MLDDRAKRILVIGAIVVMVGGAGVVVILQIRGCRSGTGFPADKQMQFTLSCMNPNCPGKHDDERIEEDVRERLIRGHRFDKMLPWGYTDWPVPCPKCVEAFGKDYRAEVAYTDHAGNQHSGVHTGRSAFNMMTCGECGTKWMMKNANNAEHWQCPGCSMNTARREQ